MTHKSDIVIKKINNNIIFYDNGNEKNIEQLFLEGRFVTKEINNVEFINNDNWIKKHYFRKGTMSFLKDKYLRCTEITSTRSYREFSILNHLTKKNFNTCKPVLGWAYFSSGIFYQANLVVENIKNTRTLAEELKLLQIDSQSVSVSLICDRYTALGKQVAKMHLAGVYHGDLNLHNILINKYDNVQKIITSDDIHIIDFDKSDIKIITNKDKILNTNRLMRSLKKLNLFSDFNFDFFQEGYNSVIDNS